MRRFLPAVLMVAVFTSCVSSPRMMRLEMPPLPPEIHATGDLELYAQKYKGHDAVYLFFEYTLEHSGNKEESMFSAWSFHQVKRERYMILNPDVTELTTLRLAYKPKSLYVRLLYPDGSVLNYGLADLIEQKNVLGGDSWTLIYPAIVKGTIVDFGYEVSRSVFYYVPLDHNIPLQFVYPCEKLKVSYAYPDWWMIQTKRLGPRTAINYLTTRDINKRKRILTYEASNVPAVAAEPYSPYFKEMAKYLQLRVTNLEMSRGKMKTPANWDLLSSKVRKRVIDHGKKKEKKLNALADSLTLGKTKQYDRARAIVDYVQEKVELGFSFDDRNYFKVLQEGKGDSFEITGLVWKMLDLCGVPAEIVLVSSAEDGYFDPDYITLEQFKYPAISINIDGCEHMLFPYIKELPLRYIPGEFQGQTALTVTDLSQQFSIVPMGVQADNAVKETLNISISQSGFVSVEEEVSAAGSSAYGLRESLQFLNESERKQALQEALASIGDDVDLDDLKVEHLESRDEPLLISLSYTMDNCVTLVADEAIFQTAGLLTPVSISTYQLDSPERSNPIKIPYRQKFEKEISIHFPESWQVKTEFADTSISNDLGWINSYTDTTENSLRISQELVLRKTTQPRESARDLVDLTSFRSGARAPVIVFSTQ